MLVDLAFSENGNPLTAMPIESPDSAPVPAVGDRVWLEDNLYTVESREFRYEREEHEPMINAVRARIALECKLVAGPEHVKRSSAHLQAIADMNK
jgi:hypothetical protein